jgi:pyruvate dehydrogenase E2 component (dihydrolipoamide acetyltransferase)
MAIAIDMPKLSDTMEEGVIAKWNVKEGDQVKSGDVIAEVETDKATMDVEVFDDGTILKIIAAEGDAVPLGGLMAVIGDPGENIDDLLAEFGGGSTDAPKKEEAKPEKKEAQEKEFDPILGDVGKSAPAETKAAEPAMDDGRIKASPLARKMAEESGIELSKVKGSGPEGRIVKKDIETFKPETSAPAVQSMSFESKAEDKEMKISQMRKTIARRLAESKFTSPHFYETIDINMKEAVAARSAMNEKSEVKISFNDLVIKACALALRKHPEINSSWMGDVIRQHGDVHVAMAVAIDDGLITPVIRHTDQKGLMQIAAESKDLAKRARNRELQPQDWEGSTFSVSNLGMFGIDQFTAIINPPNASILAIGSIRDTPVVENGAVVPGKMMKVTLSSDHRVVDGAVAAQFLNSVRDYLENPVTMLL